ncbi:uncharacterized protein V6R79_023724 [Siganus canaliculatus]
MDVEPGNHEETGFSGEFNASKVQERLQKRHQMRMEDAERKKEAKESQSVAEEKGEYFFTAFDAEKAVIEELLSGCSGADRAVYDLRRAQGALQKLQTSLAETREESLPKKKFAFRARTKAADKVSALESDKPSLDDAGITKVDGTVASVQCGFSNMDGVHLTKTADEIQNRDVLLTHLTNCTVRLLGSPSTLHLKHIDSCEILSGPVSSSVFIDHCRNSTLAFPCQQLRTHNTTDTQVYLHVTSRAIIEDCRGVSFAPFSWSYPTLEEDFAVSGLDQDRNNWSQVDDFNWLAAGTPSPNWTVIPEVDRKTTWD